MPFVEQARQALARPWVHVLIGAAMLMGVVAASGRPTVFNDTSSYYQRGEIAVQTVARAAQRVLHHGAQGPQNLAPSVRDADPRQGLTGSRSPLFGLMLYGASRLGTLWLVVAINAVAAAWTVRTLTAQLKLSAATYLAIMAALAGASALPFFVGFAMPDIFGPIGVIAAVTLALFWSGLGRGERIGLGSMLTVSLCFHTSHVLLLIALLPALLATLWWFHAGLRPMAFLVAPLLIAACAESAYDAIVKLQVGFPPHRPPFLMARMLADGPARLYLRRACATAEPYVLCRFKALPLDSTENILWTADPRVGVFKASSGQVREALGREEPRFIWDVLTHETGAQVAASLGDWGRQLGMIDVQEPFDDTDAVVSVSWWRIKDLTQFAPPGDACARKRPTCQSRFDRRWVHGADQIALGLSLAVLLAAAVRTQVWRRLSRRDAAALRDDPAVRLALVAALFLFAIVANAAITGIISGPFARYSTRMVWLLPLAALVTAGQWLGLPNFAKRLTYRDDNHEHLAAGSAKVIR
jgi:hypothetical protein